MLFFVVSVLLIFSVFCVVLLCVFTFSVQCREVCYDFRIKTVFGSSLPLIICRRVHVLVALFVFACVQWCPTHIVLCFCFVCSRLVYPMPISLDCPFFDCPFGILQFLIILFCPHWEAFWERQNICVTVLCLNISAKQSNIFSSFCFI